MNSNQAAAALAGFASGWRKSSHSQPQNTCVEIWRKSSYSQGQNNCVEVGTDMDGWVGVRDSKLGSDGPVLAFTSTQFGALLATIRAGGLDG